ncbi:MAG: linear amide C-N hydrolase [Deltaproteobacteria bacterium]
MKDRTQHTRWKRVLVIILAILLILVAAVGVVFRHEIQTICSIQKVDDSGFYTMDYAGDYGLDEFLKAGAKDDTGLISFVTRRLMKGLPIPLEIENPSLSCSTFNAVTPQGNCIFGRNFDLGDKTEMLVFTHPDNGYASMSMINLAFLGYRDGLMPDSFCNSFLALAGPFVPLDGINEKGLTVAVLMLPDKPTCQDTDKIDITTTTAIRMLLDKAATVNEAVDLLKKYDMHDSAGGCYHYQIADAGGSSAIVEYVDNEMHVLRPEGKFQACSNYFQTPGPKYNMGAGQDRYQILMKGLRAKNGILTVQQGMDLLQAAQMHDWKDPKTGAVYKTQWSAVYNNTLRCVDLAVGRKYDKIYHYSLAD